ncbi:hypothetical protein CHH28_01240 [Bacterioplanes sanyensis]|uniref:Uncharacterized protein n=1 Tax=Bacterioplanes sanyensis TaxID=1249553 RepID=A0A222FE65_9GAMM|nr:hypothetical protein [Bacterioplanes sanyensis]ASP37387.1 hypothetical protein CHH28_01240 [Bacterioplanes sanyensis]
MDKTLPSHPSWLPPVTLAYALCLCALGAHADDYYTSEIDRAVEHAQANPVRSELVGDTWYDRSTYRSFALPSLPNDIMDSQVIEGAMGPTAAGEAAAAEADRPVQQAALGQTDRDGVLDEGESRSDTSGGNEVERDPNDVIIDEISYESEAYTGRVKNVRGRVNIRASATP